jgi:hypothetical protein
VKLPEQFAVRGAGVAVRRELDGELARWLASDGEAAGPAAAGGRGGLRVMSLPAGGSAFVRRYRHGGLLGRLLGEIYWQHPSRPWRELLATEAARAAGIAAPEVLAAAALPVAQAWPLSLLYRGVLVTRGIEGRRTLADALRTAGSPEERRRWILCAAAAMARLHAAGIRHPDLNAANFLVGDTPEEPAAVIDFDRARVGPRPVGALGRALARRRVARSVAKLGLGGLDRAAVAQLLRAAEGEGRA